MKKYIISAGIGIAGLASGLLIGNLDNNTLGKYSITYLDGSNYRTEEVDDAYCYEHGKLYCKYDTYTVSYSYTSNKGKVYNETWSNLKLSDIESIKELKDINITSISDPQKITKEVTKFTKL